MIFAVDVRQSLTLARIAFILGLNALAALGAQGGGARPMPLLPRAALTCCVDSIQTIALH